MMHRLSTGQGLKIGDNVLLKVKAIRQGSIDLLVEAEPDITLTPLMDRSMLDARIDQLKTANRLLKKSVPAP